MTIPLAFCKWNCHFINTYYQQYRRIVDINIHNSNSRCRQLIDISNYQYNNNVRTLLISTIPIVDISNT